MPLSKRTSASLALSALVLLSGAVTASNRQRESAFRPYVPTRPPQQAVADFDGDGRLDLAIIGDDSRGPSITLELSRSTDATRVVVNVTGISQADIDHDGDFDLIAATPSGEVLVWLNDGHGHFARLIPVSPDQSLSSDTVIGATDADEGAATGVTALLLGPFDRAHSPCEVEHVRCPTVSRVACSPFGLIPLLRAPPSVTI